MATEVNLAIIKYQKKKRKKLKCSFINKYYSDFKPILSE